MRKVMVCSFFIGLFTINFLNIKVYGFSNEENSIKAKLIQGKVSKEKVVKIKNTMDKYIEESKTPTSTGNNENDYSISKYGLEELTETYILQDLFLSSYNERDGLMKLITKDSRFNVKVSYNNGVEGISSLTFDENNEAQVLGTVFSVRKDSSIPNFDTLASIISDKETNIKDIKFAHSFRYYTTFVIIQGQKDEYIIPYSTAPQWIGLTNGKLYTSKEAVEIMSSFIDEKTIMEQGNYNGGYVLMNTPDNYVSFIAILTLVSALLIATVIFKKSKDKELEQK